MRTLKILRGVAALLIGAAALVSCEKEEFGGERGGVAGTGGDIRFVIGFAPQTRVSTDADFTSAWEDGDEIGIFAVKSGETLSATASANYINNVKLTYSSANGGSWTPSEDMWWPGSGGKLDFYAYYPYDAGATDPTAITFNVKTDQSGTTNVGGTDKPNYNLSDLLTAKANNSGSGYGKGQTVPLQFSHALSLVQVDISDKEVNVPFYDADKLTVTLKGVKAGATLDLGAAGGPAAEADDQAFYTDVVMTRVTDAGVGKWVYRALVPAQIVPAGRLFTFVQDTDENDSLDDDGDINFAYTEPSALTLAAGAVKKHAVTTGWGIDATHKYKVGDRYPHAGPTMGIVYWLDPAAEGYTAAAGSNPATGLHGKIVSLDERYDASGTDSYWSTSYTITGATNATDGLWNMNKVYTYNSNSFSDYPAFGWCDAKNGTSGTTTYASGATGVWYLPAKEELKALYAGFSGKVYEDISGNWNDFANMPGYNAQEAQAAREAFNTILQAGGGVTFATSNWPYYWSSTEDDDYSAWLVYFGSGYTGGAVKSYQDRVRAVLAF